MVFDPFGDFASRGYLRNNEGLTDPDIVKLQEHLFFIANLDTAFDYLAHSPALSYASFLLVHQILFSGFYPWAGQDRHSLGVGTHVGKGNGAVEFEQASLSQRAVEWGLQMGANPETLRRKPGSIMGLFAWGHPFLDGNGRTMLLIHTELCARAGFAIDWGASPKNDYLQALTDELWTPDQGILDRYFAPLIRPVDSRLAWRDRILAVQGLDGMLSQDQNVAYEASDPEGPSRYDAIKKSREESNK